MAPTPEGTNTPGNPDTSEKPDTTVRQGDNPTIIIGSDAKTPTGNQLKPQP